MISDRIIQLRKMLKLSQTDFGKALGVSLGVISNIERNLVPPKSLLLDQICKVYNVNSDWLLEGEGPIFKSRTDEEEIAFFLGKIMSNPNSETMKRIISALSKTSPEDWELFLHFLDRLVDKQDEKKEDRD